MDQLLALSSALGLGFGARWIMRLLSAQVGARRSGSRTLPIASVGRLSLSQQHALHVVGVGQQAFLVATSTAGCQLLCELAAGSGSLHEDKGRQAC